MKRVRERVCDFLCPSLFESFRFRRLGYREFQKKKNYFFCQVIRTSFRIAVVC